MKKAAIIFMAVIAAPVLAWAAFNWNGAAVTVWNGASVSAWNGATVSAPAFPTPVAWWKLDNGALTTDSSANGMTLTDRNTVGTSTGDYKQGDASADFEKDNSENLNIADASLSADFPLKSGSTNNLITICVWFKMESITTNGGILAKWDSTGNKRSIVLSTVSSSSTLFYAIGYNSGSSTEYLSNTYVLSTGIWYNIGLTYNQNTKAWTLRVWDDTAGEVVLNTSGTSTNFINVEDSAFTIGSLTASTNFDTYFDGLIDNVIVFKEILSPSQIDEIRAGTKP